MIIPLSRVVSCTLVAVLASCSSGCSRSNGESPSVRGAPAIRLVVPSADPATAFVEVTGLPDADLHRLRQAAIGNESWTEILRVAVKPSDGVGADGSATVLPAMLGTYSVEPAAIRFTPRFPFDPGRDYQVVFDLGRLPGARDGVMAPSPVSAVVSRPRANVKPTTRVAQVYPSGDVIPENQLRLYVEFTEPMGRRSGLDYIHLLDENGREVEDPFLPLDIEFWNADRTRYTFFFDPGRVKRGILPREQLGPSLMAGRSYTLVIDADWLDAEGLALQAPFRRQLRVGPPDEHALDPRRWRIVAPPAASRSPLVVTFGEPLDHGLLLRALGVLTDGGAAVEGSAAVEAAETRWTFTPREPWPSGTYQLLALSILEDRAGNRIGRAFEVDQFTQADRLDEPERVTIPFAITSRPTTAGPS